MFTGIITHTGTIKQVEKHNQDITVTISTADDFFENLKLGDSVAVNGVCLTVAKIEKPNFVMDICVETLECTNLGLICEGLAVNLEKCLTLSTPIGGHLLTGHVHGTGVVRKIYQEGRSQAIEVQLPKELMRYIAPKGSVALDGVSLTLNRMSTYTITVNCIPHTLEQTNLQFKQPGDSINVEVDLLMVYMDRLISHDSDDEVRLLDPEILNRLLSTPETEH